MNNSRLSVRLFDYEKRLIEYLGDRFKLKKSEVVHLALAILTILIVNNVINENNYKDFLQIIAEIPYRKMSDKSI